MAGFGNAQEHLIRSYRHDPARSKRSRPIRVWLAAQDGHRTCGLLYPAAVRGFVFRRMPGSFMGRRTDAPSSTPRQSRRSQIQSPGSFAAYRTQGKRLPLPIWWRRHRGSPEAQANCPCLRSPFSCKGSCCPADRDEVPASGRFQARCLLPSTQGGYSLRSVTAATYCAVVSSAVSWSSPCWTNTATPAISG